MKKAFLFLLILATFSCSNKNSIRYIISPVTENNKPLLKVKMSFKPNKNGLTKLLYNNKRNGDDNLHNTIHSVKLLNTEGEITKNRDSGWIIIKHPKNLESLHFEYVLKQDFKEPITAKNNFRAIIQDKYFHIFASKLLMFPKHLQVEDESTFNIAIDWKDFPESYTLQNSFGSGAKQQIIKNITVDELFSALFVGGDFKIYSIPIKGNKLAFAIRDNYKFSDSTMIDILKKTVTAQRDFWQDHSQKYYSITLIPLSGENGYSIQGTGLNNSFATAATNNDDLEVDALVYLFNHELQHNWIGKIIKNDNEFEQYWFSEGFTDYYTIKNIAKDTIYNLNESYFIRKINRFIKSLYTSPVKDAPNSDINYDNFWSSRDYEKLAYRRGALLAFYLDYKILQNTNGKKSLDNVMHTFKKDANNTKQKITHVYFIKTVNSYLQEDIKPFFNAHIENGTLYKMVEIFEDLGFEYIPTTKVFDLGFEFSNDEKSIVSIDENSEAYKSGLRVGDEILESDYYKSSKYKSDFTVLRKGKKVKVSYFPVKKALIPQLKDNPYNKKKLMLN